MKKRGLLTTCVTVAVFSLLLLTLFVPYGEAKEKYVTYLSLADYTGPIAGLNVPGDQGCSDYFKYLNEKGGVNGVKIEFIGVDTRYDIARGVSAYKRYRKAHKLLVVNPINTAVVRALYPLIKKDNLLTLATIDGEFQANIGRAFLWGPPYQDTFAATLDWMVKDWKDKRKSGMPKVGYMAWDSAGGRESLRGGKEYAEKLGVTMLPPEFFPPGTLKHDVYLNRLADAGANYIYLTGVIDPTPTNIIRDACALGLTKNIQFVCDQWGPTESVGIRAHPEVVEGVVIASFLIRGAEIQRHPLAKKLWTKYHKSPITDINELYGVGMTWAMNFEAALKMALKEVGYEKLDAEAMYRAYQKLTGNDLKGLTGSCAYSPTSRRGSTEVKFYQVKGGKVIPITKWRKAPDAVALYKW